jgi:hypothetical protein
MLPESNKTLTRPAAFAFMAIEEWHAFNRHVRDGADRSGLDLESLEPGSLVLVDGRHLDLLNVAQLCHLSGPDAWDHLIDRHLGILAAPVDSNLEQFSMLDLRVQLLPDDRADRDVLRRLGARPFATGVVETLAARLGDGLRSVTTTEISDLGWDLDESWASAWAQTRTFERPEEVNFVDVGGAELIHLFSDHVFGASFLPYLDDIMDDIGEQGAVVSIPVRHSVLVHPIHDESMMAAVQAMIPITRHVNRSGPGSVSAHLYWWRAGSLTWIPTYFASDGIEFYPPDDLVDVIRTFGDLS